MGERTEVAIDVDATADRVYALVADIPSMGRWSPECVRCDWLDGATTATAGARFVGHNRKGWHRWSTKGTVVSAEPGRELTFDVHSVFNLPVSRWSYVITPREGGVTLTEWTEDRRGTLIRTSGALATGTRDRAVRNRETMLVTLRRIKEAAEAPDAQVAGLPSSDRTTQSV